MKKIILPLFVIVIACACGSSDDSKKVANEDNKEKFDSTDIQDDTKFAVTAAEGGMLEVELAKLALTNASSPVIQNFAKMMIDDHSKAGEELKTLAAQKNITLPNVLSNQHQDDYSELAKKKGADFDKAYASYMVKDHKEDIHAFTKQAEKGKDAELKNWAAGKIPVLQHHLDKAQTADSTVHPL